MAPPHRTVDVNYHAVYSTIHAAMYYFKNYPGEDISKSKLIILVASMGGYNPMPTVLDYNSSKWGVRGMFWSLRNVEGILGEGKPKFRVNLIAPTWVRTNMTKGIQSRIEETQSSIKVAEVSDCVDVVLRMASDENIKGRAAAIAADKKSFDLCDDSEGLGVGKVLSDPEYLKHFGYGSGAAAPTKKKAATEEEAKTNGVEAGKEEEAAVSTAKVDGATEKKTNGTATEETAPVAPAVEQQNSIGITVDKIEKAEEMMAVKNIEIPQAIPKEVANTA